MAKAMLTAVTFHILLTVCLAEWPFGPNRPMLLCPTSYVKPKCTCEFNKIQSSIQCKGITDIIELQEAFDFDWGKTKAFDYFWIEDSKLDTLPDGIFNGVSFKTFHVMMSTISSVADKAFQGSEKAATEVNIYDSNMPDFNFNSLKILPNLKTVFIGKSQITEVPQNLFSTLKYVETIYFRDNKIKKILPDTFKSLVYLRYLDLAGNNLTKIENGALNLSPVKDKRKGVSVDLENNQISSIEPQALAGISNPGYIDIQQNKLTSLPEEVFKPLLDKMVKQNKDSWDVWVNIGANPIDCKNTDWITKNKDYTEKILGIGRMCPAEGKPAK